MLSFWLSTAASASFSTLNYSSNLSAGDVAMSGFNLIILTLLRLWPWQKSHKTVLTFNENEWEETNGAFNNRRKYFMVDNDFHISAGSFLPQWNRWNSILWSVVFGSGYGISGDEIYVYEGNEASPSFIYAITSLILLAVRQSFQQL